ncbi:hypothetical protein J5N97_013576 [Dioscorea zingiberensis]|uniref:Bulb-type lectin domain-containing protein n=1 Tax=Dioscorea zingiberensis TaxID=325984 RepID=A0A9D5CT80_9LILI|nr:hypothetical protein J5N97_013576 [Dioscorea zingiberensis]
MAPSAILLSLWAIFGLLASHCKATDYVLYSNPTTKLLSGQSLSYDMTRHGIPGPASLVMQEDCNLVSYYKGEVVWASNTTGKALWCYLYVDELYHRAEIIGVPTESSGLPYKYNLLVWSNDGFIFGGDSVFILQWNGVLGLYGPSIWSSPNEGEIANSSISSEETTDYVIYSYSVLPIGLIAKYKNFQLVLEDSCNLVLSRTDTGKVLWQSHKFSGSHDCFVTLDGNGELFVTHGNREILWRSETRSKNYGIYVLALRKDARLVIYGPQAWSSTMPRKHISSW